MASSHPCEEKHQCSICLDEFVQPVTTPCGHNYCRNCITEYWSSNDLIQCPLCKKMFHSKPELQVNTESRYMVERLNNMRVRGEDQILAKPGEVPCDICPELKLKAQKTCMECLVSFCQSHLEPHQRVTALKKHKLIDPVSNLEERIYSHVMHEAVPPEQVFWERKAQLENVMSEMKMMEDTKTRSIEEIKYLIEQRKKELDEEMADIDEVFAALVASFQRSKAKLIESIQETEKAAEKQVADHVTQLEQQVNELGRKRSKMEHLLQTEDEIPSLDDPVLNQELFHTLSSVLPTPTHDLSDSSQQTYLEVVKKAVAQMENTLSNEMEVLIHKVQLPEDPPQENLMMIQQCNAVDVTLDARRVHPSLMVSEDGKELRFSQSRLQMFFEVIFGDRSQGVPLVLGKDGYSSGRFYYEVQVSGSNGWVIGVVKEHFKYDPRRDICKWGWSLDCDHSHFVLSVNNRHLFRGKIPQKVGVFVDYEKGEVSFYDVGARTLIYSYTGCDFTENIPRAIALIYSLTGYPFSSRQKLYPVFVMLGEDPNSVLEITPVDQFSSVCSS